MTDTSNTALRDMLADYLNNHLSPSERVRVERALESDADLRDQLQFEQQLQAALRDESEQIESLYAVREGAEATAGFEVLAEQLDRPRGWLDWLSVSWRPVALPACLMLLVVSVYMNAPPGNDASFDGMNEFKTLTDPQGPGATEHLQVLLREPLSERSLGELAAEHGLEIDGIESAVVVRMVPREGDLLALADALRADARVQFVKVVRPR